MAEKKCNGYKGQISHSGAQVVKAPMSVETHGKSTVQKGNDLRQK